MEVDYPSNHLGGKLPILDLEVWVEGTKVLHRFYKKSMATKMVILARSAIPTSSKRSILIAEALRRMLNCHPDLPRKEKADYLTEFCVRMADCGHSQRFLRSSGEESNGEIFYEHDGPCHGQQGNVQKQGGEAGAGEDRRRA